MVILININILLSACSVSPESTNVTLDIECESRGYDGGIPNWWILPPPDIAPPICNPATQPNPDWGVKNGQCLQSCGQLADPGSVAFSSGSCSAHEGLTSAGVSYDVPVCCKPREVAAEPPPICNPTTQPSPHWGVKNGICLKSCGGLAGAFAVGLDSGTCSSKGFTDAGESYDNNVCCVGKFTLSN